MKFGKVAGSINCVEKEFKMASHKYEEYKGMRFYNGDFTLVPRLTWGCIEWMRMTQWILIIPRVRW